MRYQSNFGLLCLVQCCTAILLPTEQQPLKYHGHRDVQAVRAELKKAEIIPTVIDDFLPSLTLTVSWSRQDALLGNTIKPSKLRQPPEISLHDIIHSIGSAASALSYVITLTDPDAPTRENPEWSEFCHWIAANVSITPESMSAQPKSIRNEDSTVSDGRGDDVVEYKPPGPPKKTGKHRYMFLVFAPKNGTTEVLNLTEPKERKHWGTGKERGGVRDWALENGLVPVAANFIYAENKKQ